MQIDSPPSIRPGPLPRDEAFNQNESRITDEKSADLQQSFRRTARNHLAALGVDPHVAERCLNHKLKGVEGI